MHALATWDSRVSVVLHAAAQCASGAGFTRNSLPSFFAAVLNLKLKFKVKSDIQEVKAVSAPGSPTSCTCTKIEHKLTTTVDPFRLASAVNSWQLGVAGTNSQLLSTHCHIQCSRMRCTVPIAHSHRLTGVSGEIFFGLAFGTITGPSRVVFRTAAPQSRCLEEPPPKGNRRCIARH